MNDVGVDIPFPILLALLAALYWQVTLAVAVVFVALGIVLPWLWVRVVCFVVAALLVADCLWALWLSTS